jgi:CheY-like chemotaxis protein
MVQGLVAQSGGRIHIKTAMGQGTSVELWLPLAQAGAVRAPGAQQEIERVQAPSLNVLVVDDDPLVLMGTADLVEDLGHQVRQAPSATDALALLEREQFDVVLSDQAMPGMTGVELAEEIARRQPDLPVILTTGYADISQATSLTLRRLSKPFSQKDLDQVLRDILTTSSKIVPMRPRNLTI